MEEKPLVIDRKVYEEFLKSKEIRVVKRREDRGDFFQNLKILKNYTEQKRSKKLEVTDWTAYFNRKYEEISNLITKRMDVKDVVSISRLVDRKDSTIIAVVNEKRVTAKGNILLILEDPTGETLAIVNQYKKEIMEKIKEVVLDEVAGFRGVKSGEFFFVNDVIFPDIPYVPEKKAPNPGKAAFISDLHIGSNKFLMNEFEDFIEWLNGKGSKSEQEMAKQIRYLFIGGDLVDGVGIYPEQIKELTIGDVYEQYEKFAEYMKRIPEDIKIIVIPGNHDGVRLEEPQPPLYREFAKELKPYGNILMLSNPSYVNIHAGDGFEGFNILNYHGYSFDSLVSDVEPIRKSGGYDRGDKIMEFLLKKRHLAPSYGWVPISPMERDYLFVDIVPDIFVAGHIHKSKVGYYKNILTITSSCWQGKTVFQERVGHHPEPGRVPIFDLKTRKMTILKFV